jgi:protein-S-isoprenylcysteine O-methyltransferase Ste14
MTRQDIPTLLLGLTVTAYWMYVLRMVQRVRADAGRVQKVLIPAQRREKLMWIIWVPVIGGWFFTPLKVAFGFGGRFDHMLLPASWAASGTVLAVRFAAVVVAVGCLALSIKSWRHMGRQWRMGIDPTQKLTLLVDGPFARVRHPIYALSILLMLCSVIVLPTPAMCFLAAIHITLMHIKARNEERFLLDTQGASYADYCRRTGRFIPFLGSRGPAHVPNWKADETDRDRPIRGWKDGDQFPFRMNAFQQAMLRWDLLHPYNAVHAVRVAGPANVDALRDAAWEVAKQARLGEFALSYFRTAYEYRPLQFIRVQELAPGRCPQTRLAEVLTEEINTPFHGEMHHPIRWTVFNEPDEGGTPTAHYVVLCYHHAISDAHGIERLLAAVLRRYLRLPATAEDARLTTRLTRIGRPLRPRAGVLDYVVGYIRLSLKHREMRAAHRMPDEEFGGDFTAVAVRTAPDGLMERLAAGCKQRGVGVNDALLAAFASAVAEQTPDRLTSRHRQRIAVATVVSARKYLPREQVEDFGVCLSSILAVLHQPDLPIEELVQDVARQTRVLKSNPRRATAETTLRYFAVRWLWWMAAVKHNRRSYRRVFPICGGVSTVFVDENRFADLAPRVSRYVRACPTGPITPLVLGPTIYNGRLELGLTYRIASRTRGQAEAMLDTIVAQLERLADGAAPAVEPSPAPRAAAESARPALAAAMARGGAT